MAVRNLWLLGGGLAACLVLSGDGYPQQPPPPASVIPSLPPPVAPDPVPPPTLSTGSAPAPSLDQLLDRLTDLRRQKAELEKQEQLLVKQLRDKLKAQTERLEKLGIATEPKTAPLPKEEAVVPGLPRIEQSQAPR